MPPNGIIWLSKMEKKEKRGVLLCYARSSARSWGASHIPSNPRLHHSSMGGQGRELNTKPPAGDVAPGARLWGESSASPTVVSEDPEARGGSRYHRALPKPHAQVTRGDTSSRPGASEHSLFETPPAWEKHLSCQRTHAQEPWRTI